MKAKSALPVAVMMLVVAVGCNRADQKSQIADFDARFKSITIGMTRSQALSALGLGRHEVYEIEHPDGRLVHTKLYWYEISEGDHSVRWQFKVDADLKVVSKRREASNPSVERSRQTD